MQADDADADGYMSKYLSAAAAHLLLVLSDSLIWQIMHPSS